MPRSARFNPQPGDVFFGVTVDGMPERYDVVGRDSEYVSLYDGPGRLPETVYVSTWSRYGFWPDGSSRGGWAFATRPPYRFGRPVRPDADSPR